MTLEVRSPVHNDSLADVLERILDKGVVIAGDIAISLVGIELLTIRLRLLIATVDKAKELGINWWEADPMLSTRAREAETENALLLERIAAMEQRLEALGDGSRVTGMAEAAPPPQATFRRSISASANGDDG